MERIVLVATIFSLSAFNVNALAQVQPTNQSIDSDTSVSFLAQKYRHITRAMVEERSMFRVGLNRLSFNSTSGPYIGYNFDYERKIDIPISLVGSINHQANGWENNSFGVGIAVRYYYAQLRRIEQGKSANNLSANYFSLRAGTSWFTFQEFNLSSGSVVFLNRRLVRSSSISLVYGLQRRLGKYMFADFNLGYSYRLTPPLIEEQSSTGFISNFTVGLGI